MRGYLLSLDAIVASGLLLLLALTITAYSFELQNNEIEIKKGYYISKDMSTLLFDGRVQDVENLSIIQGFFEDGTLTQENLNNTLIELIGFWWAEGNITEATNLTASVVEPLINHTVFGVEVLFDNSSIYKRDRPQKQFLVRSTTLIAGVEFGKQPTGHVTSAFVTSLLRNSTLVYPFHSQGSAVNQGEVGNITKKFYLNASHYPTIHNATLYLSLHTGDDQYNDHTIMVNGNDLTSSIEIIDQATEDYGGNVTNLTFGTVNLLGMVQTDQWNIISLELDGDQDWHSHIHPGSRVEVEVEENVSSTVINTLENVTHYFDWIQSEGLDHSGAWAVLSFPFPKNAQMGRVLFYLSATGVNDVAVGEINDSVPNKFNIQVYLNNLTINLSNPPTAGENHLFLTFNLTDKVTEGDNLLAVYLNAYGNNMWGTGATELYADPENNVSGSTRVEVSYIKPPSENTFGHVIIDTSEPIGASGGDRVVYEKNVTDPLYRMFLLPTQLEAINVTVNVSHSGLNRTLFQAQHPGALPSTLYVDPQVLSVVENNTFTIEDLCLGATCQFLADSSIRSHIWIPTLVGYGNVFDNASASFDDAMERLESVLAGLVKVTGFVNDTQSVPVVPHLWGPAKMEVRVWI